MRIEIRSGMPLLRWCFHLIRTVNGKPDVKLKYWPNCTGYIELQHVKPLLFHVETIQYLLASSFHIFACCRNNRQVCGHEQASGKLETNATRGWRH